MSRWQLLAVTCLALVAFAANSVLCRLALSGGSIDAGTFTAVRICSGALSLLLIVSGMRVRLNPRAWFPAGTLFAYAACFSFAYLNLSAGTGALLLFGAVQATMLAGGVMGGERPTFRAWIGWAVASAGLVYLVTPGVEAPQPISAGLMAAAGIAWGIYSLIGRKNVDPVKATMQNFVLAAPMSIGLFIATQKMASPAGGYGIAMAVVSGAVTSGLGYVVWYSALRHTSATGAAAAQLTVPIIAAVGGVVFLAEPISPRLAIAATLTLGGVALALRK